MEGIEKRFSIEKLIERQLLQRLLDSFAIVTRLRVAVTDVDGKFLLNSREGDCGFCKLVKANPVGLERCQGSYARAGRQAAKWNEPYIFRCHAGLITWACPIVINDNHIGNIVCGQVMMWEPEEFFWEEMEELTRDLHEERGEMLEAARRLEIVSAPQVQAAADLLYITANYLTQSGTDLLNYQHRLRSVGSWLWVNYRKGQESKKDAADVCYGDLENHIFAEIRQGNSEKARELLDKLALQFFTRSKGQLEVIKGLSIEFVISLGRLATEFGVKFEESFRYGILKFKQLEEADTVEKVFLWLLSIGNSYIDVLAKHTTSESEAVVKKAVGYIEEHYASPDLSLDEIAKAAFISPTYLSRLFKKKMGYTLMEHIRNIRIDRAKQLLQQPDKNTTEVAHSVGYSDRSYFCKVFKQIVGLSPNEYRKKALLH